MFFELQLSAGVFTRIVRNRLKAIPLCLDRELTDPDGNRLVVDRVVVGDTTWIQREQTIELVNGLPKPRDIATQNVTIFSPQNLYGLVVPFLQVKQEVSIHLVKSADLDANGANPTPPFRTLAIYPVFNVSLNAAKQTQGGGPLSLSYSLAHVDFGALILGLSEAQRAEIKQSIAAIQLPSTTIDLGPLTALLKRPVSAVNAGIACDPAGSFVALRADFDIHASPVALSREFFEAGPAPRLAGHEWAMLIDANLLTTDARAKATDALKSDSKVKLRSGPHVTWDPAGPAIDINAGVELIDACPFFVDDIDMDADVVIRAGFSVPTPDMLRTHFHLTGEPSDVGEEIACALTGALLWPFIGPLFLKDEDLDVGLGAYFAGLAGGPVVTFFGIVAAIETKGITKDLSKSLGGTCHKVDDENYECNDPLNLLMPLIPPQISRLELAQAYGVAEGLVLAGPVRGLAERIPGTVKVAATPLQWTLWGTCRGGFGIVNQAQIRVEGTRDGALCHAYVLEDPLNEFTLSTKDGIVSVRPRFEPAYQSAPYACRVRVVTTRGVRTIRLVPPTALTEAERLHLESRRHNFTKVCQAFQDTFHKRLDWKPERPGPVERPNFHFWQVVVKGLSADDAVRVEGPEGELIVTARPSRAGVTHLSMMFSGDTAPAELSLTLQGSKGEDVRAGQVSQQQVLFQHRASLPVRGRLRGLRFDGHTHQRSLVVLDGEGETTWEVTAPHAPALLSSATRPECEGGDGLVVHTGKHVGAAPAPQLLRALECLGNGGPPEAVGSPRVGGIARTLYVENGRGARLFDISIPEEPREIHAYENPAWYLGVALGGRLMARHEPDRNEVELYVATVSESV